MVHPLARIRLEKEATAWLLTGTALLPFPLAGLLHVESAAIVAFVAWFIAGAASIALIKTGGALLTVLGGRLVRLAIPLALLTASLLWRPNCGYFQGLLFFALFPVVTTVLSVSLAWLLTSRRTSFRRAFLVHALLGTVVSVVGPIYDLGFHPQFYTYNHVFGGVLGPIYDDELAIRSGLFAFRGLTLLWALLLITMGNALREKPRRYLPLLPAVIIAVLYLNAPSLGINTTHEVLRSSLGGHVRTPHFDVYYDPQRVPRRELRAILVDHEYRYARLAATLDVKVQGRIQSYLYPDADTRQRLTGARYTNVAPVYLKRPQVHILQEAFDEVFTHELVHVFGREFGVPVLRASPYIGLVEGLAVALEPPDGLPSPDEQVAAALIGMPEAVGNDLARAVASRLTVNGFWTGRGAVSYTTMGSFVGYLHRMYGITPLKRLYGGQGFEAVYRQRVEELAAAWLRRLTEAPYLAATSGPVSGSRFSILSLFEERCPHYVPKYRRDYRRALRAWSEADTLDALEWLNSSIEAGPYYAPALTLWGRIELLQRRPEPVASRLLPIASRVGTPGVYFALADALARTGRPQEAEVWYDSLRYAYPASYPEYTARVLLRDLESPVDSLFGKQAPFLTGGDRYLLRRCLSVLRAVTSWERSDFHGAELHARQATQAFLTAADLQQAARMRDFAARARWAQLNPFRFERSVNR